MKAFTISALISGLLNSTWVLALAYANRHNHQSMMIILLGGYGVVVLTTALVSISLFREQKWQAACGALATSLAFVCVIVAGVAWHHHITTALR